MGTLLLIILVIMLLGAVPAYPYSRNWGYGPSGLLGLLVLALVVMLVIGTIPWGFGPHAVVVGSIPWLR
jgi:hypothetical protein